MLLGLPLPSFLSFSPCLFWTLRGIPVTLARPPLLFLFSSSFYSKVYPLRRLHYSTALCLWFSCDADLRVSFNVGDLSPLIAVNRINCRYSENGETSYEASYKASFVSVAAKYENLSGGLSFKVQSSWQTPLLDEMVSRNDGASR